MDSVQVGSYLHRPPYPRPPRPPPLPPPPALPSPPAPCPSPCSRQPGQMDQCMALDSQSLKQMDYGQESLLILPTWVKSRLNTGLLRWQTIHNPSSSRLGERKRKMGHFQFAPILI